jgi:hypothetical protein
MEKPLALLALAAALGGCATATQLPDADRQAVIRGWEGRIYYLRASLNVMPFFVDGSKHLVSPWPPDSLPLLEDTKGAPILPGAVEEVLPLGTKVRVDKIEFPTALVITRRPLYTPRENPWVYLSVPGRPRGRPFVAVLRHNLATRESYLAALNDLFCEDEPSLWLKNLTPEIRRALEEKRLLAGMDADAVATAWGKPEKIQQELDAGVKVETWTWPLGKRTATFRDGKLTAASPALEKTAQ